MKTQVLRTGSRVCQGQAAFSLVEVLFAAILVVTLFISLYVGLSTGFSITQTEREGMKGGPVETAYGLFADFVNITKTASQ